MKQKLAKRRLLHPLTAFLYMAMALVSSLAIIDYHPYDPSYNFASDTPADNILGITGAYFADFFWQSFGYASFFLSLTLGVLAIRVWREERLWLTWVRLIGFGIPSMVGLAVLMSYLPISKDWIFFSYGGLIGSVIQLNYLVYSIPALTITILFVLTLLGSCIALSLKWSEITWFSSHLIRLFSSIFTLIHYGCSAFQKLWWKLRNTPEEVIIEATEKRIKKKSVSKKTKKESKKTPTQTQTSLQLTQDDLQLPYLDLLNPLSTKHKKILSDSALENNARLLEKVLADYGVKGEILNVYPGPVVTLYELEPEAGTKTSKVVGLSYDIARSMSAKSARISVTPGRSAIGIELPNASRETVFLRELLEEQEFQQSTMSLPIALGKDISGTAVFVDMAKMPHVLVAGTTGSGKSVAVNSMIISLLYALKPQECKFIMIDPKMLELSVYNGIPHLLTPVVTEPAKAVVALKWVVKEMEDRYRLMSHLGVRNIAGFNKRIEEAIATDEVLEREVKVGFVPDTGEPMIEMQPIEKKKLPFIVVVVDEMADLMLVAGKEIEGLIQRLAQMARAAGIHIILATQRPSVDVITGVIKANLPTRISFQVTSKIDSRTILGEMGAEQLLGMGDMLYMYGGARTRRVHGPFVSDKEVEAVVSFLKEQSEPDYEEAVTDESATDNMVIPGVNSNGSAGSVGSSFAGGNSEDELYDRAVMVVVQHKRASTSFVQRQLRIGYNKAANLIERMEEEGVLSAPNHAGKREILAPTHEE